VPLEIGFWSESCVFRRLGGSLVLVDQAVQDGFPAGAEVSAASAGWDAMECSCTSWNMIHNLGGADQAYSEVTDATRTAAGSDACGEWSFRRSEGILMGWDRLTVKPSA
jgi:hypothetical protein